MIEHITHSVYIYIDGVEVEVKSIDISMSVNAFYHTANIQCFEAVAGGAKVYAQIGDYVFDGFVYSSTRNSKNSYTLSCRSKTATLTEPFESSSTYQVIEANSADELCDVFSSDLDFSIEYHSADFSFGGSYEKTGTTLEALANIAETTASVYFFNGDNIIISPNEVPTEETYAIPTKYMQKYIEDTHTIANRGIKYIEISQSSSSTTSLTADVKCDIELDECTEMVTAYIVPFDSFQSAEGIELRSSTIEIEETETINSSFFKTKADISSISEIRVNGISQGDIQNIRANVVEFSIPKKGLVYIKYIANVKTGFANIRMLEGKRYAQFDIYYNMCDVEEFQAILSCAKDGQSAQKSYTQNSCSGVSTIMPKNMNYAKGFEFHSIGGAAKVIFEADGERIDETTTKTVESKAIVEDAAIEQEQDTNNFFYKARYEIDSVSEVRSRGESISFTNDTEKIYFDENFKDVVVSYITEATKHTVQFNNIENSQVKMLVYGEDIKNACVYNIEGYDSDSLSSIGCGADSIPLDIAKELGVFRGRAVNKIITVTDPSFEVQQYTTDAMGIARISTPAVGDYQIDASSIEPSSKIILTRGA